MLYDKGAFKTVPHLLERQAGTAGLGEKLLALLGDQAFSPSEAFSSTSV